ncbi:Retrovirus-related Pol polyprotein from transposon 17.6 [Trichinella nativa]|uniref:RNA-directed DNA polymerase n=1 Tax=Trichinella nativa TaxID=6335 RepID=A0A0V1KYC9_9BILA|nr:Retrovirus-related Pol polyprotein from transposon 17.6 [Trichinella nativa]
MRSAACDAAVSVLASQPNTETQPAGAFESRSTAATDRIAVALEEEEEQSFDALAVGAHSEQNIDKLMCEFRRLLTQSVRLRGRVANPPPEQLSDAACWTCGKGGHYRRSCPLANAERPRHPPNIATNRVRTLCNKTQGVVLSVNTKWAAELAGKVNGRSVRFLVDTGAAVSVIRESEVNMAGNVRISRHGSRQIVAANGECLETVGTAELDIKLGDKFLARHSMIVARNLSHPCLLGTDFLRPRKALIDLGDGRIKLDGIWLNLESPHTPNDRNQREAEQECDICLLETVTLPARTEVIVTGKSNANWTTKDGFFEPAPKLVTNHSVMAACSLSRTHRGTVPVRLLNGTDTPITLFKDTKLGTYSTTYSTESTRKTVEAPNAESTRKYSELIENMAKLSHDVPHTIRRRLRTLLWKYKQIIATDEYNTGRTNACKHSINTGDASPIKQPPRRIPYHQKETVRRMLSEMTNHKVIEPSCGPWSSPIVLVKKKDGSYRFCVDYRKLNLCTKKDAQPLPKIEETLETLSGATWFSTLDMASGYWQVEVADEDKEKSAFATPFGLYQFRVMPFGLCNAPATFQRLMETVLCGLHWTTCMVYLDDIIVFSKDAAEHLEKLEEVFSRLQGAGLKIKPSKCHLFQKRVKYLGHVVSRDGVQPDPEKIKAVEQWPSPKCGKELQQFLGLASYYRRFVKGFAQIAEPLHRLTEKGKLWNWTDECDKAFLHLKARLTKQPVLTDPDFKIPFLVDTDASGDGLGAVLSQDIAGKEGVIAYASRTLSKTERKYCATRREMLALVWALKQFRCFLYGRKFTVRTDHGSLTWLRNFKEPEGQVARWLQQLGEFDFEVIYRPGRKHQNADALSRGSCKQCGQHIPTSCTTIDSIALSNQRWQPSPIWPAWTPAQLEMEQQKDPDIARICRWVATKTLPGRCPTGSSRTLQSLLLQKDQLMVKDGILLRRRMANAEHKADHQLVVPQTLRQDILQCLHSGPEGGHLGKKKTLWKIRQRFYWPDLSEDVADWCRKCPECNQRKSGNKHHRGQLEPQIAPYPMSRIGVDIIGPFQRTERGNKYILTVQDYFSKWPEAYPIPDMTASTVARTLVNEFICRYGAPESLRTNSVRHASNIPWE